MPRVTQRVSEFLRRAQQYLYFRDEVSEANGALAESKKWLSSYLTEHGELDARGHFSAYFEQPLMVNGKRYIGVQRRKSVSAPAYDYDKVEEYVRRRGLWARVIKERRETYIDTDELDILNQEGVISDHDLDSLMKPPTVTWSVWPLED